MLDTHQFNHVTGNALSVNLLIPLCLFLFYLFNVKELLFCLQPQKKFFITAVTQLQYHFLAWTQVSVSKCYSKSTLSK